MEKQKFILIQFLLVLNAFANIDKVSADKDSSSCYNPNGNSGKCVPFKNCPSISNIIKTGSYSGYEFARQSACVPNGNCVPNYVCCTSDTDFSTNKNSNTVHGNINPSFFPQIPVCGKKFELSNSGIPALGEFPWVALLEYKNSKGELAVGCAGSILNNKYILTAAHCVNGYIENNYGKLVSVRVGANDMKTTAYCNSLCCTDKSQRLYVEESIVHAGYDHLVPSKPDDKQYSQNDLALIRTKRYIEFSNFVGPVCLPNVLRQSPPLENGSKLSAAGWDGLRKLMYGVEFEYYVNEDCDGKVTLGQFCAGDFIGDSGGGLVRLLNDSWILEGVYSYSANWISYSDAYTRVRSYIAWIHKNVRP